MTATDYFLQRSRIACNARVLLYLQQFRPSVCLSVCHTLVLYPDKWR